VLRRGSGSIKEPDDSDIRLPHEGHILKGHAECHSDLSTVLLETSTWHAEALTFVMNPSQPDLAVSYAILAIGTERSHVGEGFLQEGS